MSNQVSTLRLNDHAGYDDVSECAAVIQWLWHSENRTLNISSSFFVVVRALLDLMLFVRLRLILGLT
jgi:hypothetical protein